MAIASKNEIFKTMLEQGYTVEQAEAILSASNIPLDTLTLYRKLTNAGFTKEHAERIVKLSWENAIGTYE